MTHFNQSMSDLLAISKKILQFNQGDDIFATKKEKKKATKDPILKALSNFSSDYTLSDEEGNKEDVMITYQKIRIVLLKGWKIDDWLKNGSISIFSGAIEPDMKRRIMLSAIYFSACRCRDQSNDNLKGLPIEAFAGREELLFPSMFQLYMYRVFLYCLDGQENGDDITKLGSIVAELEKELKIPSLDVEKKVTSTENPLLDGFLGMAKDLVSKMGVQIPEGAQVSTNPNVMMETVTSLFSQPGTKDFIADISESMKGSKDFADAFGKIMTKFQDPESLGRLNKMASSLLSPNGGTSAQVPLLEGKDELNM